MPCPLGHEQVWAAAGAFATATMPMLKTVDNISV